LFDLPPLDRPSLNHYRRQRLPIAVVRNYQPLAQATIRGKPRSAPTQTAVSRNMAAMPMTWRMIAGRWFLASLRMNLGSVTVQIR
jgi:hypothetical protein